MPEIRVSVYCINQLSHIWHELDPYKAPEQLVSSSQLEQVIHFLINEHNEGLKNKVKELEDKLSKEIHRH